MAKPAAAARFSTASACPAVAASLDLAGGVGLFGVAIIGVLIWLGMQDNLRRATRMVQFSLMLGLAGNLISAAASMRGGWLLFGGLSLMCVGTFAWGYLRSRADRLAPRVNVRLSELVELVLMLAAGLGWLVWWTSGAPVWVLLVIEGLTCLLGLILTIERSSSEPNAEIGADLPDSR